MERAVRPSWRSPSRPAARPPTSSRRWPSSTRIGFPVLVRPSYVLGGRAMQIVYDRDHLARAMAELAGFGSLGREGGLSAERPVLVDRFLEDATEVDVDAIRDDTGEVLIGGVMEHVEEAGVHSGDSACAIPPPTLPPWVVEVIEDYTRAIAERARRARPDQRAVRGRSAPGVRDRGQPAGQPHGAVRGQGHRRAAGQGGQPGDARRDAGRAARRGPAAAAVDRGHVAVKEAVLPFNRFPEVDTALGPEMRSTGEVMGIDATFGLAFSKAELAAGTRAADRRHRVPLARRPRQARRAGGRQAASRARPRHRRHRRHGRVPRPLRRSRSTTSSPRSARAPSVTAVDLIADGKVSFVVNTPQGRGGRADGEHIRKAASAPPGQLRHHGRGRAGRGAGHGRAARPSRSPVALAAGVPRADEPTPWRARRRRRRRPGRGRRRARSARSRCANPVMTASGTAGHGDRAGRLRRPRARSARVVVKSLAAFAWAGNPAPRLHPTPAGMLNAVGLQGPGVAAWLRDDLPGAARDRRHRRRQHLGPHRRRLPPAPPSCSPTRPAEVVAVEVNLSCPNLEGRRGIFAHDAELSADGDRRDAPAAAGRAGPSSAPTPTGSSRSPPRSRDAGAEAVTLVNTLLGLAIDPRHRAAGARRRRRRAVRAGDPPGRRARRPRRARRRCPTCRSSASAACAPGWDAVELLLAGASAVQVGTATFADPRRRRSASVAWLRACGVARGEA